jgi:hypothetical protein
VNGIENPYKSNETGYEAGLYYGFEAFREAVLKMMEASHE